MQKVAIIGYGFMGGMHAQIYRTLPNADLAGIIDTNAEATRRKLSDQGHVIPVYENLSSLLAAEDIDVVDICGPTDQHVTLAIEAARAGKHLFIEKPLSLNLAASEEIQAAVVDAGVFAQVGHCIRFWPEYVALREYIESGEGGALKSLSLHRRAGRPSYSEKDWLNQEARSGGAALDLHIHDTDYVISLLGTPKSVTSRTTEGSSGPDHIFTLYEYDKVHVQAEGGWDYPAEYGFSMAFEAVFENACVRYDSSSSQPLTLIWGDKRPRPLPVKDSGPGDSTTGEGNLSSLGGYWNEIEYFIGCLERGSAPEQATLAQSAESLRVTLSEIESGKNNRTIYL